MRNFAKAGETNNRLTLVRCVEKRAGSYVWIAACECGNGTRVTVRDFRSGHTKSCGCLRREVMREIKTTHGMSESAEFNVWCHILGRCNNTTDAKYPWYGARGIKVCERWTVFENFYMDMGERPSEEHSIDRINNDGNYEPSNCKWATRFQQAQNKRNNVYVELDGTRMAIAEAERYINIGGGSISQKVRDTGWTHQQVAEYFLAKRRKIA
jgi:hypothetical protein